MRKRRSPEAETRRCAGEIPPPLRGTKVRRLLIRREPPLLKMTKRTNWNKLCVKRRQTQHLIRLSALLTAAAATSSAP